MKKILIIEDEEDVFKNYLILFELLESSLTEKFVVLPLAKSYDEAINSLELNPDIILLDNWLNEYNKSGIDLFLEFIAQIPIYTVFITAEDKTGSLKNLVYSLEVPVIDKPINFEKLRIVLDSFLKKHSKPNFIENLRKNYNTIIRIHKDLNFKFFKINHEEVDSSDIVFVQTNNENGIFGTIFYFADSKKITTTVNLYKWEKRLQEASPNYFFKIGANCIINKYYLDKLISPNVIKFKDRLIINKETPKFVEVSKAGFSEFLNKEKFL